MKPTFAFDVCHELYRAAREVLDGDLDGRVQDLLATSHASKDVVPRYHGRSGKHECSVRAPLTY
jgi:hypothetical protein